MQLEQLDWRAERSEYKVGGDNILQVVVLIPLGRRYCMLKPDEKEWDRMRKRGVPRRVCTCTGTHVHSTHTLIFEVTGCDFC